MYINIFDLIAILITLSAFLMYINFKYLKMPMTIGLMFLSIVLSFFIMIAGWFDSSVVITFENIFNQIDFNQTLMGGMLSFLLFAGALPVDINDLNKQKDIISILATIGVVFTTFLVGIISFYLFTFLGFNIDFIYCLLFGALIAPTDPISVLAILKNAKAPKELETKIAGESLFNDGVGVVVFTVILDQLTSQTSFDMKNVLLIFIEEAIGGILFGFFIGWLFYKLLKTVDDYILEIMLTLSLVTGGYALASHLHLSGPLAMVVAGLLIGNHGKNFAMSDVTHRQLFSFWELIDEFLNACLFVLMGVAVLVISFNIKYIIAGFLCIPLVLMVRFISIAIPVKFIFTKKRFSKNIVNIMTWGGLRGGISIALALSLINTVPDNNAQFIITITYIVVVFSILVQGLTIDRLIKK